METEKFLRTWNFGDISSEGEKFTFQEIFQRLEKLGTEIFETVFIDVASSKELIKISDEAHRYAVKVDHIDPELGCVDERKVFIYKDLFGAFQKMNQFEYSMGVNVEVYDFNSQNRYLHLYYKLEDSTGYARFAQPEPLELETRVSLRGLWDTVAKVFY